MINRYALLAPPPMTQNEKNTKKPPQPVNNTLIYPENSNISSETKKKPQDSDRQKEVNEVRGENIMEGLSESHAFTAPGNTAGPGDERKKHVQEASQIVAEVVNYDKPD